MSWELLMWMLGLGIPAFMSLLILFLQDRNSHKKEMIANVRLRDRSMTIMEVDMTTLKSTTEHNSMMLGKIDERLSGFGERIARVEAKLP